MEVWGRDVGSKLSKLWGIDLITDIKIHIPLDGMVRVTIEKMIDEKEAKIFEESIETYSLTVDKND
jgi:hypothetical protein